MGRKVKLNVCDGVSTTLFVGKELYQKRKNTGMLGVSVLKSVSKNRINVWDGR